MKIIRHLIRLKSICLLSLCIKASNTLTKITLTAVPYTIRCFSNPFKAFAAPDAMLRHYHHQLHLMVILAPHSLLIEDYDIQFLLLFLVLTDGLSSVVCFFIMRMLGIGCLPLAKQSFLGIIIFFLEAVCLIF